MLSTQVKSTLLIHTLAPLVESHYSLSEGIWKKFSNSKTTAQEKNPPVFAVLFPPRSITKKSEQSHSLESNSNRPDPDNYLFNQNMILVSSLDELKKQLGHIILNKKNIPEFYLSTDIPLHRMPTVLDVDHIHPLQSRPLQTLPLLHLYGSMEIPETLKWVQEIEKALVASSIPITINGKTQNEPTFAFIFRHSRLWPEFQSKDLNNSTSNHLTKASNRLMTPQGYGIELAIRDSEYTFADIIGEQSKKKTDDENRTGEGHAEDYDDELPEDYSIRDETGPLIPLCGVDVNRIAVIRPYLGKASSAKSVEQKLNPDDQSSPKKATDKAQQEGSDEVTSGASNDNDAAEDDTLSGGEPTIDSADAETIPLCTPSYVEADSPLDRLRRALLHDTLSRKVPLALAKDIGTKASQFIIKQTDPLHSLLDLTENFPLYAPSIANQKLDIWFRKTLNDAYNKFDGNDASILINGRTVSGALSLWQLNSIVSDELRHSVSLNQFGLWGRGVRSVSEAGIFPHLRHAVRKYDHFRESDGSFNLETVRVAVRPPDEVFYMNNVLTDKRFSKWPSEMSVLEEFNPKDGLPAWRRNFIVVTAFLDLAAPESMETISEMLQIYEQNTPIRFAIVPIVPLSAPSSGNNSAAGTHGASLNESHVRSSLQLARWWVAQVLNKGTYNAARIVRFMEKKKQKLTVQTVKSHIVLSDSSAKSGKEVGKANAWMSATFWRHTIEGKNSTIESYLAAIRSTLSFTQLPVPCCTFNGIICPPDGVTESIRSLMDSEVRFLKLLLTNNELNMPKVQKKKLAVEDAHYGVPGFDRDNLIVEALWNTTRRSRWIERLREIGIVTDVRAIGMKDLEREKEREKEQIELAAFLGDGLNVDEAKLRERQKKSKKQTKEDGSDTSSDSNSSSSGKKSKSSKENGTQTGLFDQSRFNQAWVAAQIAYEKDRPVKRVVESSRIWSDRWSRLKMLYEYPCVTESVFTPQIFTAHLPGWNSLDEMQLENSGNAREEDENKIEEKNGEEDGTEEEEEEKSEEEIKDKEVKEFRRNDASTTKTDKQKPSANSQKYPVFSGRIPDDQDRLVTSSNTVDFYPATSNIPSAKAHFASPAVLLNIAHSNTFITPASKLTPMKEKEVDDAAKISFAEYEAAQKAESEKRLERNRAFLSGKKGKDVEEPAQTIEKALLYRSVPLSHVAVIDPSQLSHLLTASSITNGMTAGISQTAFLFYTPTVLNNDEVETQKEDSNKEKMILKPLSFESVYLETIDCVHPKTAVTYTSLLLDLFIQAAQINSESVSLEQLVSSVQSWATVNCRHYPDHIPTRTLTSSSESIDSLPQWNDTLLSIIKHLGSEKRVSEYVKQKLVEHAKIVRDLSLNRPLKTILPSTFSAFDPIRNLSLSSTFDALPVPFLITNGLIRPILSSVAASAQLTIQSSLQTTEQHRVILPKEEKKTTTTSSSRASAPTNLPSSVLDRAIPLKDSLLTVSQFKEIEGWELLQRWVPLWRALHSAKDEEMAQPAFLMQMKQIFNKQSSVVGKDGDSEQALLPIKADADLVEQRMLDRLHSSSCALSLLSCAQSIHSYRYPRASDKDKLKYADVCRFDNAFDITEGMEETAKVKEEYRKMKVEQRKGYALRKWKAEFAKQNNKQPSDDEIKQWEAKYQELHPTESHLKKSHSYSSPFTSHNDEQFLSMTVCLNPLSDRQRPIVPFVLFVREQYSKWLLGRMVLTPVLICSALPMRSFYRFSIMDKPLFSKETGQMISGQKLVFPQMAESFVFTLNHQAPAGWMVAPKIAVDDLDNIKFDPLGNERTRNVTAVYQIEKFLIQGHVHSVLEHPSTEMPLSLHSIKTSSCYITQQTSTISTAPSMVSSLSSHTIQSSTVVLQQRGYFQLPAPSPGIHLLSVNPYLVKHISFAAAESQRVTVLTSENSLNEASSTAERGCCVVADGAKDVYVHVSGWGGVRLMSKVNEFGKDENLFALTIEEMEKEKALEAKKQEPKENAKKEKVPAGKGKKDSISQHMKKRGAKKQMTSSELAAASSDMIHIFTICSGHLYERLAKIMMISVLNNTQHKVKFWFLGSVTSPMFRETLPKMANSLGFEYELMDYGWPHEVATQPFTKMRTVWAMKILFLDVLFPLDLDRVIFVDADNVCKTDMIQLMRMNLKGAPYAFTPFCNNREEMKPYRFWETGYWANELKGKPYHISALFVVDLKKFRMMGADNILRDTYEAHARDKNSLSNLDQDLPNLVQDKVPIYSLPQDWLWCGSWCSDETQKRAKTIDLCNNPHTHEHKLAFAKRAIPEWSMYHQKVLNLEEKLRSLPQNMTFPANVTNTNGTEVTAQTQPAAAPKTPRTKESAETEEKIDL
ncbi:putative UDP-glucose [Monocercomonoides exilis]|uniref:putative UDP-glucose n=1 Tax=Monocercomonoides exilis TaxID=2049356 RepID=UPI00355AB7DA|nr:putative UDP-glucose [Monocercomonoides exilis]|eukprot:MONOS_3723.1-p1 / transcript=MONOS_3723.1 / gene=MONOS_3723 / organism=Monocercomonoides_exilis_PA203 / gene_product=UDP-glucose / transcript_product=UDP-glucose / location=Mono_scaffold00090:98676-106047(-) / protein_length=2350 / sequence_SO=supercontig / SO=protein_coding / is_pseudo=false